MTESGTKTLIQIWKMCNFMLGRPESEKRDVKFLPFWQKMSLGSHLKIETGLKHELPKQKRKEKLKPTT
jgi:hypothetical protein